MKSNRQPESWELLFFNISLSQKFVYLKHFLTQNLENFLVQILQKYLKRQTRILPNISCDVHFSPRLGVSEQKWCISHDECRGRRYLDLPLNLPVPYKYLDPSSEASQYIRYIMIDPWFQIYRELEDEGARYEQKSRFWPWMADRKMANYKMGL